MGNESSIGSRVVVTGLAGSGKSTFARALAGWVAPSETEWRTTQIEILSGEQWIADGNYDETLALRVELADTVVVMDTRWPTCFRRALGRGIRRTDVELPPGCARTRWRRLRDEWGVAGRVLRKRRWEPELERGIIAEHGRHATLHRLTSPGDAERLLAAASRR